MMAEYPYSEEQNSFLDILRQAALIGGAGLAAYKPPSGPHGSAPSPAPLGYMLMAGSKLMGEAQERKRDRVVKSTAAQVGLGELNFNDALRQLAESGYYSPEAEDQIRKTYQARQEDAIRNPLMAMLTGENTKERGAPMTSASFGSPRASEGAQGFTPAELQPAPFMQRTPEDTSARLNRFFDEGGAGAVAQFALLNPQAANAAISWRNETGAMRRAQAEMAAKAAKAAKEQEQAGALADLVTARLTPGTPLPTLQSLGDKAVRLGAKHEDVWKMLDRSNKIPEKISTALMLMGFDGTTIDPTNPRHRSILETAERAAIEKESDAFVRQRARLIGLTAAAEAQKPLKGEAQNFVNLDTGEGATATDSMADLKRRGGRWVALDGPGRRTIQAVNTGKRMLIRLVKYSLGGAADEEASRALGVPVGTILPGIYAKTPQNLEEKNKYEQFLAGLNSRLQQKKDITFDALSQNLPGRQARLVRDTWNAYLALVGRAVAGDTRFSDNDTIRTKSGIAQTGLESIASLPDTEQLARAFFETQFGIMDDKIAEALSFNTFGDIADIVRRVQTGEGRSSLPGELPSSAPTTNPAAVPPAAVPPTTNPAAAPPTTNPAAEPTNAELMRQTQELIRQYMQQ